MTLSYNSGRTGRPRPFFRETESEMLNRKADEFGFRKNIGAKNLPQVLDVEIHDDTRTCESDNWKIVDKSRFLKPGECPVVHATVEITDWDRGIKLHLQTRSDWEPRTFTEEEKFLVRSFGDLLCRTDSSSADREPQTALQDPDRIWQIGDFVEIRLWRNPKHPDNGNLKFDYVEIRHKGMSHPVVGETSFSAGGSGADYADIRWPQLPGMGSQQDSEDIL